MPLIVYLFAALVIASIPLFVWGARGLRLELPARQRRVVRANLGVSACRARGFRRCGRSCSNRTRRPASCNR